MQQHEDSNAHVGAQAVSKHAATRRTGDQRNLYVGQTHVERGGVGMIEPGRCGLLAGGLREIAHCRLIARSGPPPPLAAVPRSAWELSSSGFSARWPFDWPGDAAACQLSIRLMRPSRRDISVAASATLRSTSSG